MQTPSVRIEQRYSTLGEDEVVLLAFDENAGDFGAVRQDVQLCRFAAVVMNYMP